MSTGQPPPPPPPTLAQKLGFVPLHRTVELENIHAHVIEHDLQQIQSPSPRRTLVKHMTVIGDGSDMDNSQQPTQQ